MAITSNLANVATVTRASKAWDDGWSGVSGGTVGTLTEYASGVARVGTNGLLVEESSTNHIRNPRAETLTTGFLNAGGVLPLYWGYSGQSAAINVVGSGTENGWRYVDIQVTGLTAGFYIFFDENNRPDPTGLGATGSVGIKIVGGSTANLTSLLHSVRELNSGSTVAEHYTDILGSIDTSHKRFHNTVLSASLGVSNQARHELFFGWSSGATDLTLRFYVPQLETKAYPTSPILPVAGSPAASTRAADVVSITAGAWYADEPFSIAVEFSQRKTGSLEYVLCIADAAGQDYSALYISGSNSARWFNAENGSITENKAIGTFAGLGASSSVAIRQAVNDLAASVNGFAQVTDATWVLPVNAATRLVLGANPFGSSHLCGYIKEFRYWPRALTDAELEALVGN